jgi:hypothetical protein
MKENLIVLEVVAYFAAFIVSVLAFVHAGDFIGYLLKKFPPESGRPKRAHANAPRKPRRPAGVA